MDLQKRKQELEQDLQKTIEQIQSTEKRLAHLRNSYQQISGAIAILQEQLQGHESANNKENNDEQ
jgi:predicted  nucleic acid-binding Zn-ribbon protein